MKQVLHALADWMGVLSACQYLAFLFRVVVVRIRYLRTVRRLKRKTEKINVVFLVHSTSKWKCQSLYEAMVNSGRYEPVLALNSFELELGAHKTPAEKIEADERYFRQMGCFCCRAFDVEKDLPIDLAELKPDIVFYQEPWRLHMNQLPYLVSQYALCCYVPYSVEYVESMARHARAPVNLHFLRHFQQMMFANFTWCERQAKENLSQRHFWERAGEIIGSGHPIMDQFHLSEQPMNRGYTIYAPHFSIDHGACESMVKLATFKENGRAMLSYAKRHKEFNWVFKPHPIMRERFLESGYMTAEEFDDYFNEWKKIGLLCTDGSYPRLFNNARALISDSCSFLLEFVVTGRPIIRPVPANLNVSPCRSARPVIDSLYETHGLDELMAALELVLERGEDPKRDGRMSAAAAVGLIGSNAGRNIVEYFDKTLDRLAR